MATSNKQVSSAPRAGPASRGSVNRNPSGNPGGVQDMRQHGIAQRELIEMMHGSPRIMQQYGALQPMLTDASRRPLQRRAVVQRVGIHDVDWNQTTAVMRSNDGADGVYFFTVGDERLVVKPDTDPTTAVENNAFLGDMGINAPDSRSTAKDSDEGAQIHALLTTSLSAARLDDYQQKYATSSHFVIMSRVGGESFKRLGGATLRARLANAGVQRSLGKQLIADAFLDIGDRLLTNQNPGNLMVDAQGVVYAIDNEIHPKHPVDDNMQTIRDLLAWNGNHILPKIRLFAVRSAVNNNTDAQQVVNLLNTRTARTNVRRGIQTGFADLVAAARQIEEGNHLYAMSQDVIALAQERANASSCYLTNACLQSAGLGQDCMQLQVLRRFRDDYLAALPDGKQLISFYYHTAPLIVNRIDQHRDRRKIYRFLLGIINECVNLLQTAKQEQALHVYCDMTMKLARHFIFEEKALRYD